MYDDFLLNDNVVNESNNVNDVSIKIDEMFNSLTGDIDNFNKVISNVSKQKKEAVSELRQLEDERQRVEKAKLDFENYVRVKNSEFEKKEEQIQKYLDTQRDNLMKSESDFKDSMNNSLSELELTRKEIEIQKKKLDEEKSQFESYKNIELNRIRHSEETLNSEREQFERYKEINNQKIELETKNLEQKCRKFKELINQFNSKFQPVLNGDKE